MNKTLFLHQKYQIERQSNEFKIILAVFGCETPISMHTHPWQKGSNELKLQNNLPKVMQFTRFLLLALYYYYYYFFSLIYRLSVSVTNVNNSLECRLFTNRCKLTHFA